jgi:hypothetical protein
MNSAKFESTYRHTMIALQYDGTIESAADIIIATTPGGSLSHMGTPYEFNADGELVYREMRGAEQAKIHEVPVGSWVVKRNGWDNRAPLGAWWYSEQRLADAGFERIAGT